MKKIFVYIFLIATAFSISGAGYKGTLPDLTTTQNEQLPKPINTPAADVLPLDKLTIPVRHNGPIDKIGIKYTQDLTEAIRQLERIKEILDGDKSYKNFVAAANVLDLTTTNILNEFPQERFEKTNQKLSDINHDTQQIKNYWIIINKNAPYVSYYTTQGAYSGAVLNEQLNNFSKVLEYAIRDIKSSL